MTGPGGDSGEIAPDDASPPPAAGLTPPDSPGYQGFESPPVSPAFGYPPPAYPPPSYPPAYPPPSPPSGAFSPPSAYPPPGPPPGGYPPPGFPEPPGYSGSPYPPEYGAPASGYGQPYPGGYPTPDYQGGYPMPGYSGAYGAPPASGTNTLAIASLICSCVGLLCWFSSVVGIVLGAVALNQIKQTRQEGYGLAVAGIAVGIATMLIGLILTVFAFR